MQCWSFHIRVHGFHLDPNVRLQLWGVGKGLSGHCGASAGEACRSECLIPAAFTIFTLNASLPLCSGHVYYFLEDVYPQMSGRHLLSTPAFIKALFPVPEVDPVVAPVGQVRRVWAWVPSTSFTLVHGPHVLFAT